MKFKVKIAIIIPVHNRKHTTLKCHMHLAFVLKNPCFDAEIIIIDDGSTDGTGEALRAENINELVILEGDGNLWWTGAVNKGVEYAMAQKKFDYILLMNDDVAFENDFIQHLISSAQQNPASIIGAITLYEDASEKTIWKAGMSWSQGIRPFLKNNCQGQKYSARDLPELLEVDAISGRGLLIPMHVIEEIGLFDDVKFPHGYADHEFCMRAKKRGYRLLINTRALIYSQPDPRKSFSYIVTRYPLKDLISTFSNIKFDWNIKSLLNIYTASSGYPKGIIYFTIHLLIIGRLIFFKSTLPHKTFEKYLSKKYGQITT